jgi:hypothetical protein
VGWRGDVTGLVVQVPGTRVRACGCGVGRVGWETTKHVRKVRVMGFEASERSCTDFTSRCIMGSMLAALSLERIRARTGVLSPLTCHAFTPSERAMQFQVFISATNSPSHAAMPSLHRGELRSLDAIRKTPNIKRKTSMCLR